MDFHNYLKMVAKEINQELDSFFKKWSEEVELISSKLVGLNNTLIRANSGGKRLRGILVKLGFEIARDSIGRRGGLQNDELSKEILKPAVAYELFQTAILAHDDIIDKSDLRRGNPTLWKSLGGDHYGISQTICLGDIGFFLAYKLISESNFPEKEKNQAISYFTNSMLKTALGEMLDVEIPHQGQGDEDNALTIFRFKTAHYTLIGPLQLGVILAGGDQKLLVQIEKFGESLGIAFQIQDDILGVFGDEKTLGKSVTSDIEEGKNTLLIIEALKKADPKQKEVLERLYGKGKVDQEGLEKIRKVFKETGALEYSQKKAQELVEEAKKIIEEMKINTKYKNLLMEMAEFLVARQR